MGGSVRNFMASLTREPWRGDSKTPPPDQNIIYNIL